MGMTVSTMSLFRRLFSRKKAADTGSCTSEASDPARKDKSEADPYEAADLVQHRRDSGNMNLGFESIHAANGHFGVDVTYYAALRQVIVHSYGVRDDNTSTSNVERIDIPEGLTEKSDIIAYVKPKAPPVFWND